MEVVKANTIKIVKVIFEVAGVKRCAPELSDTC